jgi:hypothetical protein
MVVQETEVLTYAQKAIVTNRHTKELLLTLRIKILSQSETELHTQEGMDG